MTQGTQNTIIPTNLPSFPWVPGDLIYAVPLNNEFIALQNQITNLANQVSILQETANQSGLGVAITVDWGGNTNVTAGPYVITGSTPYGFTIMSMDFFVGTNGGSFVVTLLDNNVPVTGFVNVAVSGPVKINVLAPFGTIVNAGDQMSILVSNVLGTPQNAWVGINGTTNVVLKPAFGNTTGFAAGVATVVGVLAQVLTDQAIFTANGTSVAQAHGMGIDDSSGIATGSAIVAAVGVHVTIGSSVAITTGTSTAAATGTSTAVIPNFVLDDPNFGKLDVNPLL